MRAPDNIWLQDPMPVSETPRVANELIDLLTVILGHAALLWAALGESDPCRDDVTAILIAAERASRITSELLGISRDA
jgi:hypothetical protein